MLWVISYGTVEYAGLPEGDKTPRFSNAWKPLNWSVVKTDEKWNVDA